MAFASSCIVAWSSRVPRLLPIAGRAAAGASLCSSVDATAATRSGAQAGHAVEGAIRARGEYRLTDNASYAAAETAESPNRALMPSSPCSGAGCRGSWADFASIVAPRDDQW
jgi:hypothetical protein